MTVKIPVIPYTEKTPTSTRQDINGKDGCPPGFKKVNGKCVQKGIGPEYNP
tara:strand:+ start:374 stop:526 length:153 start_codon:yes stop_codon:yes gene_type:complete